MKSMFAVLGLVLLPLAARADAPAYDLCGKPRADLTVCVTLSVQPTKESRLQLRYESGTSYNFPATIEREPGKFELIANHYAQGYVKNTFMYLKLNVDDSGAMLPVMPPIPPKGSLSYRYNQQEAWRILPSSEQPFVMKVPMPQDEE